MNKFGNTVTSARRRLDMYLFMYVSDVVALNESASPANSYCYLDRIFTEEMLKKIYYKDGVEIPSHNPKGHTIFEWKPSDLVAVNRNSTAFPQVMRMFGAPDSLTMEMEDRRMKSWKHTIAFGTFSDSQWIHTSLESYAIYEMEDGAVLRLTTEVMLGFGGLVKKHMYVFDKKHLSSEQISRLSSVTPEMFQSASGGNA